MDMIWTFLNSPLFLSLLAIAVAYGMGKLFTAKPEWVKWKGIIIEGIKAAEKAIPDGSFNGSIRRLDEAMKYIVRVYQSVEDRPIPPTLKAAIREALPLVHAEMERDGNINTTLIIKNAPPADPPATFPCSPLWLIPIMLASMFFGGCTLFSTDQKAELLAARHTYAGVVNVLTIARRQGYFTKSQGEQIGNYVDLGADILNKWEAQVRLGNSTRTIMAQWQEILLELTAAQVMAEQSKPSAQPAPTPTPAYEDPFNPTAVEHEPPRVIMAGFDPASVMGFLSLLLALGILGEQLSAIVKRIMNGEEITEEELAGAKAADDKAQADWHAASKFDQPD